MCEPTTATATTKKKKNRKRKYKVLSLNKTQTLQHLLYRLSINTRKLNMFVGANKSFDHEISKSLSH